tara:strand:- start:2099 stop:2668 length:570 start_codon:yes stop_codon:yes gene_type:complete
MRTHENADPNNNHAQVDFCWDAQYIQMSSCYSDVHNNTTPHQAWRAGFREGVKMSLDRGVKSTKDEFLKGHQKNLHMLYVWLMVGADVKNGEWAILGARTGLYKTMCTDWDYVQVRNFKYLNNLWNEEFVDLEGHEIYNESIAYGSKLINELDIPIAVNPLDSNQSKFFKTVYQTPVRNLKSQKVIDPE